MSKKDGENMYRYQKITLMPKPGQQVLVTSDIHGCYGHLVSALEKAHFTRDDLLIIVGDILEKGYDCLKTLRYIMQLSKTHQVIALIGNVDLNRLNSFASLSENPDEAAYHLDYLKSYRNWRGSCFYDDMYKELGLLPQNKADILKLHPLVMEHFKPELDFLWHLPTVLETPHYIFTHGGLPDASTEKDLDSVTDPYSVLKLDRFMEIIRQKEQCFDRYIVSGHWPVSLYNGKIQRHDPIIDDQTHSLQRRRSITITGQIIGQSIDRNILDHIPIL